VAEQRAQTVVHLVRHGEVHNPEGVLYGRRDGYHLSELGQEMAERVAKALGDRDVVEIRTSPLERARETAAPLVDVLGLTPQVDPRLIESGNVFEGRRFGHGDNALRKPSTWVHLWNPWRPSWGEPYKQVVARMLAAVHDARDAAAGHETVLVSHQLPIWITRLALEKRSFVHDPRRRQCTLCSVTSLTFAGEALTTIAYSEPAGDLVPVRDKRAPFSSGDAPQTRRP
jgi:broad specificity phosphatase PhoE